MKKSFALLLVLVAIALCFNFVYAGCFQKEDFYSEVKLKPELPCLKVSVEPVCSGVELLIENFCQENFLYDKDGEQLIVYSRSEWKSIKDMNPEISYSVKDRSISQNYGSWSKSLSREDDPQRKIYIEGNNFSKEPKEKIKDYLFLGTLILLFVAFPVFGIWIYRRLRPGSNY